MCIKPSQISGIVSTEWGRYACGRGVRSTDQEERKGKLEMIGEENKALVRLFDEEFWNKGNLAAADELMAANAMIVLSGREYVSLNDFKAFAASLREAFPDCTPRPTNWWPKGPGLPSGGRVGARTGR